MTNFGKAEPRKKKKKKKKEEKGVRNLFLDATVRCVKRDTVLGDSRVAWSFLVDIGSYAGQT
jgi:hypothetical protein